MSGQSGIVSIFNFFRRFDQIRRHGVRRHDGRIKGITVIYMMIGQLEVLGVKVHFSVSIKFSTPKIIPGTDIRIEAIQAHRPTIMER